MRIAVLKENSLSLTQCNVVWSEQLFHSISNLIEGHFFKELLGKSIKSKKFAHFRPTFSGC